MISRQTKAVIASVLFFMGLGAGVLYQPAPDLVPSVALNEELADADYQVRLGKAGPASVAVKKVGVSLASWSSAGEALSPVQRSDLSLLGRDARILAAGIGPPGTKVSDNTKEEWVLLRQRVDRTLLGD